MRVADAGCSGQPSEAGLSGSGAAVRRALRAEVALARERRGDLPVRVLDVGGGSGTWAVPMAAAGCQVTVIDTSPNALAALRGRARDAGVADRVTATQADVLSLADAVPPAGADLVLGHGLLEVVDDVAAAVGQLADAVVPGGAVSVLVAGRYGAALTLAHAGRLQQASAVLTDPGGRSGPTDPLQRRLDLAGLRGLLESAARLSIELVQGDGVFEGWLPPSVLEADANGQGAVAELAGLVAATPELLVLAARLHVLARRPETPAPS
ncbi:MAG TPA: methyltransferase domain-containing protein [Pseudonocardia sp.]|uniref:class I SAM-dependent methyltransferase n=1 Tax=Pseudonocardia sp. TaxID=60912 RepID=UPI002BE879CC|nr:methyltransferase domain-containing protein [Pseudonocardia sp.]HTF47310.1 methyltransferase domain-containing protein [Pseudonocardia sp.]